MDIEIKKIDFDADSTIKLESRKETKRWSKFSNQFVPVVEKVGKNKYKLISGAEKIHIATEKGESKVNCNIIDNLSDEEKGALDLRLLYQGSESCPITLGERFLDFREKFSIKSRFRVIPTAYGEYGGQKVVEYEECIRETNTMSEKDLLELRLFNANYFILTYRFVNN